MALNVLVCCQPQDTCLQVRRAPRWRPAGHLLPPQHRAAFVWAAGPAACSVHGPCTSSWQAASSLVYLLYFSAFLVYPLFFFFWLPEPEAQDKHHKTGKLFQEINVEVDCSTSAIVLFLCNGLKIKKSPDTNRASVSSVTNITLLQFEVPYVK